jgi:hypothetical protein
MMKTRKSVIIGSLVLATLLIATGAVFAQSVGMVNQGTDSIVEGDFAAIAGGRNNHIPAEGDFAALGGGENNTAQLNHDTVSGGAENTASGFSSDIDGDGIGFATIGGGHRNTASASSSTVGGGFDNTASGTFSAISGGAENTASGTHSALGGGNYNTIAHSTRLAAMLGQ